MSFSFSEYIGRSDSWFIHRCLSTATGGYSWEPSSIPDFPLQNQATVFLKLASGLEIYQLGCPRGEQNVVLLWKKHYSVIFTQAEDKADCDLTLQCQAISERGSLFPLALSMPWASTTLLNWIKRLCFCRWNWFIKLWEQIFILFLFLRFFYTGPSCSETAHPAANCFLIIQGEKKKGSLCCKSLDLLCLNGSISIGLRHRGWRKNLLH